VEHHHEILGRLGAWRAPVDNLSIGHIPPCTRPEITGVDKRLELPQDASRSYILSRSVQIAVCPSLMCLYGLRVPIRNAVVVFDKMERKSTAAPQRFGWRERSLRDEYEIQDALPSGNSGQAAMLLMEATTCVYRS